MYKRKIMGILKYGTRIRTRKTQAFQEGGTVAVSKAYDWRDDPYELMLLQQRLHKLLQGFASGRKAASSGNKKIDTFLGLAGYRY
jgi:hypothetical protein